MDKKSNITRRDIVKALCFGSAVSAAVANFPLLFAKKQGEVKSTLLSIILIVSMTV